ncbi:hypothetical protein L6452_43456 [Arctium lappa]|uniref:Uncharacterized protein n=1 Tax=Arctium lappa TaxID=4217 RepID=A0ACB8XD45_ARCLA|nr:hypothetical protein L6452_43456 [Arctium lappa]
MNDMNPFSTDHQWIPNTAMVQIQSGGEPSHPATSNVRTTGQSGPKPIRRRSRASRRTPTTLLNASPTDFRALVQRFTGCDSVALPSASGVNLPKGPLNIDFGRNDHVNENSSRYNYYFDSQMRSSSSSSLPAVGGLSDLQGGYGMENNASLLVYEANIDESASLMATGRDGGSHGYNV